MIKTTKRGAVEPHGTRNALGGHTDHRAGVRSGQTARCGSNEHRETAWRGLPRDATYQRILPSPTFDDVHQFQFRQDVPGKAAFLIVPSGDFDDSSRRRIISSLNRKLDGQLAVSVELVSSISLSPRGKATYVDQRLTVDASIVNQVGVT